MTSNRQRASEWATWFRNLAAGSPVQYLSSVLGLWYTGDPEPRTRLGSVIEYLHRPSPKGVTLMTLPPEIRSMILSNLLVSETLVEPYNLTIPLSPTVLQACKQLNVEGTHLLYAKNVFQLSEPKLAIQFLSWEYRATRSRIREITIYFATGRRRLSRNDHPAQDHVALGYQPSYRDLRHLAASMHHWSIALSNMPPGIQTIRVLPYCFFDCCNHIQQAWPLTSTWFCPGCGLQQFCKDNKLEDYLPTAATWQIHWEQGPQMVIAYLPDFNRNLSHRQLRARQGYLYEVSRGAVGHISNGL